MPVTQFACPKCHTVLKTAKPVEEGKLMRCSKCSTTFRVGEGEAKGPAAKASAPGSTAAKRTAPAAKNGAKDRDEDDAPAKKFRKKGQKEETAGMSGLMLGSIIGGCLLVVAVGVGVVVYLVTSDDGKGNTVASSSSPSNTPTNTNTNTNPDADAEAKRKAEEERQRKIKAAEEEESKNKGVANTTPQKPASGDSLLSGADASSGPVDGTKLADYVLKSTCIIFGINAQGAGWHGTGAVVHKGQRLILTNNHVVDGAEDLYVLFPIYKNGQPVYERDPYFSRLGDRSSMPKATVIGVDPKRDLSLIQLPQLPDGIEALPMAASLPTVGQNVHLFGNAGAGDALWTYTPGQVRSVYKKNWKSGGGGKAYDLSAEVIMTSSPGNPGDSGGPLVNDRGEQVGVCQGGHGAANNIAFFISRTEAHDFIQKTYAAKMGSSWLSDARKPLRGGGGSVARAADIPTLLEYLKDKDTKVRLKAVKVLGEMGPDGRLAIVPLMNLLRDPDELTRRIVAEALQSIGAPAKEDAKHLIAALKDPGADVRRYAAGALGDIGRDARGAVDPLVATMADADYTVRAKAALALGRMGADAKDKAVPVLTKALEDEEKEVRLAAVDALTTISSPTAADVPLLVSILKHKDPEARARGAQALATLGADAKAALPDLLESAKSGDKEVRRSAFDTLGSIGPEAKQAVPILIDALKDSDKNIRASALRALARMGKEAGTGPAPALAELIKDPDREVRREALTTVAKIGPGLGAGVKSLMPGIREALQDKDPEFRDLGLAAVTALGSLAQAAVPDLIDLLGRSKFNPADREILAYRNRVAKALGKIGKPAVHPLQLALRGNDPLILWGACAALGEIGPAARPALADLQAISQGNFPQLICEEADKAIQKILAK